MILACKQIKSGKNDKLVIKIIYIFKYDFTDFKIKTVYL